MEEIDNLNEKLINLKMQYADILTKYHHLEKEKDDLNNEIFNRNILEGENVKKFNDEINRFKHELLQKDLENEKKINDMQKIIDRQEVK
jgi:hypothetical protein